MIKHNVTTRDGKPVEIWLPEDGLDLEEVDRQLDLQLIGIKSFYRALERDGKIWFGGEA
jgi:hypothetical protein